MDKTNGGLSVQSDFEVQNDVENVGGLRVWLAVTFTARGLAAPLYITMTGLTKSELSVEECPNGILCAKIPNLYK